MTVVEVLKGARAKLEHGWCQGAPALDGFGKQCDASEATCWCAIAACYCAAGAEYRLGDDAVARLCRLAPGGLVSVWQDMPERTLSDVLGLFDKATKIAEKEAAWSAPRDPCSCCGLVEADAELNRASLRAVPAYAGLLGAKIAFSCWFACGNTQEFADRINARRAAAEPAPVKCRGCSSRATKGDCCAYCFTRLNAALGRATDV